tara:strand:+ start:1119 stop:1391 length:273 start_codon:yes stop_codon:yes gene_type:complete
MPQGKGTYGDQVGRPSKEDKSKGMPYAPFKMRETPFERNFVIQGEMGDTMGNEESGKNADLIKALQDQDKASADIDKIKEAKENEEQQTI